MRWPWSKSKPKGRKSAGSIAMRGFQSAATDRLLAGWKFDGGFTAQEITAHLSVIRSRSRQMAKDAPHFKRWLGLCSTNIVGDGFILKSTPHDGVAGSKSFKIDEAAQKFIEFHWWNFCNTRDNNGMTYCDATGRKTDAEIDKLNIKTQKRDGEFFIHIIRGAMPGNPYNITWRIIRPDWCDHTYNIDTLPNGNIIHCGVELSLATRKPVAYYFHTIPRNVYVYNDRNQPLMRIPASDIIHGYTQDDEDQPRGIPEAHAGLVKLKMIEELDRAELTAAREDACSTRSYESDHDASMEAFKDLTSDENNDAAQTLLADKEPGQQIILPPGWKEKINTPQHPNANHGIFKSGILKDVASGFGVEYANFANDWAGVSFSSVRLGTISERDLWVSNQSDFISQCKTRQFLAWLQMFLESPISGALPKSKYQKFAEHTFRGRRWMWVDPMRDMNAAKVARDHGWKTDSQITEDLGGDFGDNLEAIAREHEKREEFDVPEPSTIANQLPTPANDAGDE